MRLTERFVDNSIIINSTSTDKERILNELVDTLCSAYHLEHRDEILKRFGTEKKHVRQALVVV